jgi:hypothetical protein
MKMTSILPGLRAPLLFRVVMVLIILSTISVQSAFSRQVNAPEVLPTWTKISVDAPPYFLNMRDRSMAYNPITNLPCMAYGGDALYYSCWNSTTSGWDTTVVDAGLSVGQYTAMAFDNYYRPFITYYDAWNGLLKLAYLNGGVWHIMVVPDATVLAPTTLALEEPATVEVPAQVEESATPADPTMAAPVETPTATEEPSTLAQLEQILKENPGEDPPTPNFQIENTIGYGKFSSIAIDRNNGFHISFFDEVNGTLDYQYWNGITFDGVVVHHYNDGLDTGLWTSIAVDFNFGVHIAYMSEKYDDLMYAYRAPNQWPEKIWRIETADGDTATIRTNVGSFASLALDSNRRPHISYYDFSNNNLKHAWREGSTWHQENVDATGKVGWYTSIAVDVDDRVHISYFDVSDGTLKYARRAGGNWTRISLDNSGPGKAGMFTSIALESSGKPGIFYTNGGIGALKYIHATSSNASKWSDPSYVNYYFRDVGHSTSLVLNTAGVPFISYLDATMGFVKYARSYGPVWYRNSVRTDDLNTGPYSSIALSGEYSPHIAYYETTKGNLWYASWTGSAWSQTKVDQDRDVGRYVSLAIDSADKPHISYYDATRGDLQYATIQASSWVTTTVDGLENTGQFTSITVNPANVPYISYYDYSGGSLNMAFQSPTQTWVGSRVDNVGRVDDLDVGISSSIALDSAGRPHISYYDILNKDLKYAYSNEVFPDSDADWVTDILDSTGDVGLYSSLAIDTATDTKHLCYYDLTNGNLKYAQKVGAAAWEFQVVDGDVTDGDGINEGDVGYYCSIDLNGLGQPAISYYDNSHGDLKIALSYPLPPMPPASLYLPLVHR